MENCLFPTRVGISVSDVASVRMLFPESTMTWRANSYFFLLGKMCILEKCKYQNEIVIESADVNVQLIFVFPHNNHHNY